MPPWVKRRYGVAQAADDDDCEVVGEVAAGELARVLGNRGGERACRKLVPLREQRVETLVPVQLAAPRRASTTPSV